MGQDKEGDFVEIEKILFQQEADWNAGDIDGFMEAYWKSEDLQFGGASGITWGWQQTLDNYKKVISLTGSWELDRESDKPGGHFLLIWRKIGGGWKIVADHTSQKIQKH